MFTISHYSLTFILTITIFTIFHQHVHHSSSCSSPRHHVHLPLTIILLSLIVMFTITAMHTITKPLVPYHSSLCSLSPTSCSSFTIMFTISLNHVYHNSPSYSLSISPSLFLLPISHLLSSSSNLVHSLRPRIQSTFLNSLPFPSSLRYSFFFMHRA